MAWVVFGKTQTVSDGAGKVIASIVIRGANPDVLVRARALGAKLGTYVGIDYAKAAAEVIIGPQ